MDKIDPVSIMDYKKRGGYQPLRKALAMKPQDVIDQMKLSGLRGRGGAGFPVWKKWSITSAAPGDKKYVICNADEGEPGTNKDRVILSGDPNSVFEGMAIAAYAVGAEKGYLYLRREYPYITPILEKTLENARGEGCLGSNIMGSQFSFEIEVVSGGGAYVCGEETALIESIEGRRGEPRFK
ncbi:MAG TPA: NADH-quinone oxidoreductase subunit F, partial [Clostridia bacterium]|nr:NADH-quinone oxidoreductase subunit F [Clostridia bacterium]